jgi:hypothetical protein
MTNSALFVSNFIHMSELHSKCSHILVEIINFCCQGMGQHHFPGGELDGVQTFPATIALTCAQIP